MADVAPSLLRSTTADSVESACPPRPPPQPCPRWPAISLVANAFLIATVMALCMSKQSAPLQKSRPMEAQWAPLRGSERGDTYVFVRPTWNESGHGGWHDRRAQNSSMKLPPPKRVLAVFGAESSGTKLVARLLAHATGVARYGLWDGELAVRNTLTEVHHISLPWGGTCEQLLMQWPVEPLNAWQLEAEWPPTPRFFVHPTSHARAYAASGATATAVLVLREPVVSLLSKQTVEEVSSANRSKQNFAAHCRNASAARAENDLAHMLMRDTLEQLPPAQRSARAGTIGVEQAQAGTASRLLVSYEALSTFRSSYIQDLLSDLDIRTWDGFVPPLDNANAPFVRPLTKDGRLPGAGGADFRFDMMLQNAPNLTTRKPQGKPRAGAERIG